VGGSQHVYKEGTFDARTVRTTVLRLSQCPLITRRWGLYEVYCAKEWKAEEEEEEEEE